MFKTVKATRLVATALAAGALGIGGTALAGPADAATKPPGSLNMTKTAGGVAPPPR